MNRELSDRIYNCLQSLAHKRYRLSNDGVHSIVIGSTIKNLISGYESNVSLGQHSGFGSLHCVSADGTRELKLEANNIYVPVHHFSIGENLEVGSARLIDTESGRHLFPVEPQDAFSLYDEACLAGNIGRSGKIEVTPGQRIKDTSILELYFL